VTYDPDFKVMTFCEIEYQKMIFFLCVKEKVTIAQEKSMPNIWNGTMFGDLD